MAWCWIICIVSLGLSYLYIGYTQLLDNYQGPGALSKVLIMFGIFDIAWGGVLILAAVGEYRAHAREQAQRGFNDSEKNQSCDCAKEMNTEKNMSVEEKEAALV